MSLDIWFREDIRHILMAAERASEVALAQGEESSADVASLRAYRRGYRAALSAVALAFGLVPGPDEAACSPAFAPGRAARAGSGGGGR
jgi:hypothetical protein